MFAPLTSVKVTLSLFLAFCRPRLSRHTHAHTHELLATNPADEATMPKSKCEMKPIWSRYGEGRFAVREK